MKSLNRREFMKGSIGAATTFTVLSQAKSMAANNKVVLGIMGVGGRGRALLTSLVKGLMLSSNIFATRIPEAMGLRQRL